MKNVLKKFIAIAVMAAISVSCFAGCSKKQTSDGSELLFYVVGQEGEQLTRRIDKINSILKEKLGVTVNFQMLTNQNYDLVLQSGEEYDLVFAPDYLNFWGNAEKGAFAEITDEDIKNNMPYFWENAGDVMNVTKLNGKRYGIAQIHKYAADRCVIARGDLMKKYGIEDLNSNENIEKYLTAVAENEKNIIPFDINGGVGYLLLQMFASDWGWGSISSLSYGEPVYYRVDDPEHKVFIAAEQPEMLEFTKTMKRWNEKGFFSNSVLSNKSDTIASFIAKKTAMSFINNPAEIQKFYTNLTDAQKAELQPRFFTRCHEKQAMYNYTSANVAVSAFSKNKEIALKVLNEIYANEDLARIFMYGVEGEDYIIDENGAYVDKRDDVAVEGYMTSGIYNDNYEFEVKYDFPGCEELLKKLEETTYYNPAVNCPSVSEGVREIKVSLSEIYGEYTSPRYYGIINGAPEEALKEELAALKKAGIDDYVAAVQKNLDAYLKGLKN